MKKTTSLEFASPKTFTALSCLLSASALDASIVNIKSLVSAAGTGATGLDVQSWDIDQDGNADATITATALVSTFLGSPTSYRGRLGFRFGSYSTSFAMLADTHQTDYPISVTKGMSVGPSQFFVQGNFYATITNGNVSYNNLANLDPEGAYVGFKFNGNMYGIAAVNFQLNPKNQVILNITEWWYNDTPGEGVPGSVIPEADTTVLGLAGLALGAAGLRRWRRQKNAPAN